VRRVYCVSELQEARPKLAMCNAHTRNNDIDRKL
jgi:hypothetical protein